MANPISSDNLSTQQPPKQQNFDAKLREAPARHDTDAGSLNRPSDDGTGLRRAEQRLSQEVAAATGNTISTATEARQQATALKDLIQAAPREALAAQGDIGTDAFEAAMAAPAT